MSYVTIWLQACLHWRCAYFQTLSWNDTIFVVGWDMLFKLCGSANKWSKGFAFSGKIWWQFFSCNKACSKYHTPSTTTPKYTLPQRLVFNKIVIEKYNRSVFDLRISFAQLRPNNPFKKDGGSLGTRKKRESWYSMSRSVNQKAQNYRENCTRKNIISYLRFVILNGPQLFMKHKLLKNAI